MKGVGCGRRWPRIRAGQPSALSSRSARRQGSGQLNAAPRSAPQNSPASCEEHPRLARAPDAAEGGLPRECRCRPDVGAGSATTYAACVAWTLVLHAGTRRHGRAGQTPGRLQHPLQPAAPGRLPPLVRAVEPTAAAGPRLQAAARLPQSSRWCVGSSSMSTCRAAWRAGEHAALHAAPTFHDGPPRIPPHPRRELCRTTIGQPKKNTCIAATHPVCWCTTSVQSWAPGCCTTGGGAPAAVAAAEGGGEKRAAGAGLGLPPALLRAPVASPRRVACSSCSIRTARVPMSRKSGTGCRAGFSSD